VDFPLYRNVSFQGVQTEALVQANSKTVILPVRNAMPDGFSSSLTSPGSKGNFERTEESHIPFLAISSHCYPSETAALKSGMSEQKRKGWLKDKFKCGRVSLYTWNCTHFTLAVFIWDQKSPACLNAPYGGQLHSHLS
jgi:hypothetical protein